MASTRACRLLADKHDLQQKLKLSLLHIEEKELNFYSQNCYTVGTEAALLSGFAFTAIVEVGELAIDTPELLQCAGRRSPCWRCCWRSWR